ncbi:MAG: DNA polymerase I, partial [Chloroflexi bacterium]
MNGRKRIVLVDGYGLAFRAFYGLPQTLSTTQGEPTNATFGFTSMLLDVLRVHRPDYIVISFDVGKTFRHEQFEDYKAHRAPMPEEMQVQMGRIREVIDALNIPVYEAHGFEADDVIGTLSRQASALGLLTLVVTGDSDLLQLVDENVIVILPGAQRFGEYRVYDVDAVIARYGFEPERIPEYKALVGDKSDNIPGVPGIGEKTAKALIQQFPSLEAMYEHVDEITPTRARNAIADNREVAFQSRELATVVRDVPVLLELERCVVADYDREKALALFRTLEFRHLASRLPDSVREEVTPPPAEASQQAVPELVLDDAALRSLAEEIAAAPMIALDVETDGTHPVMSNLVGIAIATAPDRAFYVPVRHASDPVVDITVAQRFLAEPLRSHPKVVTHHGKFDLAVLDRHGFDGITIEFDTMLAAYLLGVNSIGLKDLAFNRLGWEMTSITDLIGTGRSQITMDHVPLDDVAN